MSSSTFPLGSEIVLTGAFTNEAGEPQDPTTVSCRVRGPSGNVETLTATIVQTGSYRATLAPTEAGKWEYGFFGSGVVVAAAEGVFWIANSNLL